MRCSVCGEEKKTYLVVGDKFVICGCCLIEKLEKGVNVDFAPFSKLLNFLPILGLSGHEEKGDNKKGG